MYSPSHMSHAPHTDISFSNSRPNDLLIAYSPVGTTSTPNRGFRHTEAKAGGGAGGGGGGGGDAAGDGVGVEPGLRTLACGGLLCLWDLNDVAAPRVCVCWCAPLPPGLGPCAGTVWPHAVPLFLLCSLCVHFCTPLISTGYHRARRAGGLGGGCCVWVLCCTQWGGVVLCGGGGAVEQHEHGAFSKPRLALCLCKCK